MHQLYGIWQQLINAVAQNRMGLSAADLHNGPVTGGGSADLPKQLPGKLGVTVFVDIFHLALIYSNSTVGGSSSG